MNHSIEESLRENGMHVSTTSGHSMMPMLKDRRDRVILRPVEEQPLRRYDLPLYKRPDGKYVLHRIIKVCDGYYIIRGDNTYVNEKIPFDWVIGYVTEFYRKGRHVSADSKWYRFYAAFWHFVYPVRLLKRKIRLLGGRIWRKIKGK